MSRARPSLPTLVETYLAERAARHEFSPLTLRNVRCSLQNFALAMGDRPLAGLSRADVEEWLATRHRLAAATRRANLSAVRAFCQWLTRRAYLPVDPTAELPPVRVPRYLSKGAPRVQDRPVDRGRPRCPGSPHRPPRGPEGLRCAEVSRLQVGDIDFEGRDQVPLAAAPRLGHSERCHGRSTGRPGIRRHSKGHGRHQRIQGERHGAAKGRRRPGLLRSPRWARPSFPICPT